MTFLQTKRNIDPANTKHLHNICTMLAQRRRRWADIVKCYTNVSCLLRIMFIQLLHPHQLEGLLSSVGLLVNMKNKNRITLLLSETTNPLIHRCGMPQCETSTLSSKKEKWTQCWFDVGYNDGPTPNHHLVHARGLCFETILKIIRAKLLLH